MKLSKAAETQRMSHRGFQSLCHIRVRTVQLPLFWSDFTNGEHCNHQSGVSLGLVWQSQAGVTCPRRPVQLEC